MMDVDRDDAGGGTGSARRRRERRLRAYLRSARMSVAMALAESTHHSAPRGQKMARAGGRARDELHGYAPEDAPTQRRSLRHVVGHLPAPSLDVPVLQMVDQLPDIEHFFAALSPDPEQVIKVPKILPFDVPMRAALRVTQLVEQLVEVPTTVSYSSLLRTVEQHVDIPVPGASTALHGSLERISERIVAQNVDFPVGGGLQDFLPGQTSSASSSSPAGVYGSTDGFGEGVFRTFPQNKKSAKVTSHSGSELPPHPSSSTAAAQLEDSVEWLASRTTGTDALSVLSGSHRLASRSCGTPSRMRRGSSTTGTGIRVSPRMTSLLCLLSEELHRQPRAVYKYWVGGLPSCDHAATCSSSSSCFRRTVAVVCTRRVLLVTLHLALCSLPWLAGPECSAFWPIRT